MAKKQNTTQTPAPPLEQKSGIQRETQFAIADVVLGVNSAGTYKTYREMLTDPTIALADAVARAPIMSAGWSFTENEDAPPGALDFIKSQVDPHVRHFKRQALRGGLHYGWQPWEKVFEIVTGDNGRPMIGLQKIRDLLVDITKIQINQQSGVFEGFKQGKVTIPIESSLLFTNDREGDNLHGRSRLENIRKTWQRYNVAEGSASRYDAKVAGVFVIVHFPPGETQTKGGVKPNLEIAREIASKLKGGSAIAIENQFAKQVNSRSMPEKQLKQWQIEIVDGGGSKQAGFVDRMRYLDSLKFRGYLVPERAASEGQSGTKAEAQTHGDIVVDIAGEIQLDVFEVLNWHVVDQLLALNYGMDARGTVQAEPAPLIDEHRAIFTQIINTILNSPTGFEWARLNLDLDSIVDDLGIPKGVDDISDDDPGTSELDAAQADKLAAMMTKLKDVDAA